MLKSSSCAISVKKLFNNRQPADYQIATFTRTPTNFKYKDPKERDPCPQPEPPPPPPPKDDRMLWGTIALMFLAGGFVVYAKGSPEIRDWLTLNASWFDDIIAILYQENMTYAEFAAACVKDGKKFIDRLTGKNKPKQCSIDGGPVPDVSEDVPKNPRENSEITKEDREVLGEFKDEKSNEEEDEVEECEQIPPPVITKNICDIEKCMADLSESALNNYFTAKEACACYNKLVDDTMATAFTYKGMKELRHAMEERIGLVKESLMNASGSINKIDEMVRYIDCGVLATKDQIKNTKLMHRDLHEKFKASFMAYQWENDRSTVMDRQWQIVEELLDQYTSQNEYMFPGLKYSSDENSKLAGDPDVVLTNTLRYLKYLQLKLTDASAGMTDRIDRAVADLPKEKALQRQLTLATILQGKRAENEKDYKRRTDELKARNERNLKEKMKKLTQNHEASLHTKLMQIDEQVMKKFDKMVTDKVASEKKVMAAELEEMALKLKVVEAKLKARLEAEAETRRSQELWAAGASLLAATKKGDPYVRVDRELKAIEKASGAGDKLVLTVLKSIPKSVREKGIVPESVLRDSFRAMEKTARSVALVEQDGAPMPVYMLSWLQGLLLFMSFPGIPQREFEKPPLVPPSSLDTFDLLQRASFWMERGNIAVALRYVDSLKGASRAAAAKWFEAARAHLEVRQAAEAVLAHAAAMGLRYI